MNKKYLQKMVEQIEKYQTGLITLRTMHEDLWNLFELINGTNNSKEFSVVFHKHWDHIEEIIAIEQIDLYLEEINNVIIPKFKQQILTAIAKQ